MTTTTTTPFSRLELERMVRRSAAGLGNADLAALLNDEGIPVPRWAGIEVDKVPASALAGRRDGYTLLGPADVAGRWTAEAVALVLASPEASPTDGFAVARAHFPGAVSTRISVQV